MDIDLFDYDKRMRKERLQAWSERALHEFTSGQTSRITIKDWTDVFGLCKCMISVCISILTFFLKHISEGFEIKHHDKVIIDLKVTVASICLQVKINESKHEIGLIKN